MPSCLLFYINSVDIKLEVGTAITCGLILNELVTNSLKYAFPDNKPRADSADKECKIQITFDLKDEMYIMTVSDNGAGFPPELDWRRTESLGLKLVNIWSEYQLMGKVETDLSKGTKFIIKFPVK